MRVFDSNFPLFGGEQGGLRPGSPRMHKRLLRWTILLRQTEPKGGSRSHPFSQVQLPPADSSTAELILPMFSDAM